MQNKKRHILSLFIFSFLLLSPSLLFPQQNDKENIAEDMAVKLKQKVILSDEQTAKVKTLLTNYVDGLDQDKSLTEYIEKGKSNIESILNDKQKEKFRIIANDFFSEINKKVLK